PWTSIRLPGRTRVSRLLVLVFRTLRWDPLTVRTPFLEVVHATGPHIRAETPTYPRASPGRRSPSRPWTAASPAPCSRALAAPSPSGPSPPHARRDGYWRTRTPS